MSMRTHHQGCIGILHCCCRQRHRHLRLTIIVSIGLCRFSRNQIGDILCGQFRFEIETEVYLRENLSYLIPTFIECLLFTLLTSAIHRVINLSYRYLLYSILDGHDGHDGHFLNLMQAGQEGSYFSNLVPILVKQRHMEYNCLSQSCRFGRSCFGYSSKLTCWQSTSSGVAILRAGILKQLILTVATRCGITMLRYQAASTRFSPTA